MDHVSKCRPLILMLGLLAVPVHASVATGGTYSVSARVLGGRIAGVDGTARFGFEADLLRAVNNALGLGLGGSYWEEIGSQGFSYGVSIPGEPLEEHQREVAVALLARLAGKVEQARPYLLVGAGPYLMIHRYRYATGPSTSVREYAPGLSVGVGISGSTRTSPVLEARWHRVFAGSDPYDPTVKTTDALLMSAGLRFN